MKNMIFTLSALVISTISLSAAAEKVAYKYACQDIGNNTIAMYEWVKDSKSGATSFSIYTKFRSSRSEGEMSTAYSECREMADAKNAQLAR